MLIFNRRVDPAPVAGELRLTYEWRQKSRCRVQIAQGERAGTEVGLSLERGTVLRDGEYLASAEGVVVRVAAAIEQLLNVTAGDARSLTQIAYHLGNRHVPVQVGSDAHGCWLRLQLDHVLESMIAGLGGHTSVVSAPFDPEVGAYGHSGHAPKIHDFLPGQS